MKFQEPTENSDREPPVHKPPVTPNDTTVQSQFKFKIEFVTQEKLDKNNKRRYESHMISKVTHMLQSFGGQKHLYSIIGVSFDFSNIGLSVRVVILQ